jgi:hypothetical protein
VRCGISPDAVIRAYWRRFFWRGALLMFRRGKRLFSVLLFWCVLASSAVVLACQVPVFRYALERWTADQYRFVVLCDAELSSQQQSLVDRLAGGGKAGVRVHRVTAQSDEFLRDLWRQRTDAKSPLLVSLFPRTAAVETALPAFVSAFSEEWVRGVQDSAVRRELVRRLQAGDSAVWLFLESGEVEKDRAARERLEAALRMQQQRLKLPTASEMEVTEQQLRELRVPLRISFSVLPLKRTDPAESFLISCLLRSEDDLEQLREPMAFPVFGRGRVLYALVGEGIAEGTISAASDFLSGPCSCQVKEQNPGFDLLVSADWEKSLGSVLVSDPLPEQSGAGRAGAAPKLLAIPPGRKSESSDSGRSQ